MLRKFLDGLYLGAGYLAGAFMVAIFVLMMALSIGREVSLNIPAGDDIVSWCMAAMAFLGLAHTFRSSPREALSPPPLPLAGRGRERSERERDFRQLDFVRTLSRPCCARAPSPASGGGD